MEEEGGIKRLWVVAGHGVAEKVKSLAKNSDREKSRFLYVISSSTPRIKVRITYKIEEGEEVKLLGPFTKATVVGIGGKMPEMQAAAKHGEREGKRGCGKRERERESGFLKRKP
jgi:hypothetical protein